MAKTFTRFAGPKALVTVIQALVDYQRSGSWQPGLPELSPGVNSDGLDELLSDAMSVTDKLQEVLNEYETHTVKRAFSLEESARQGN